MTTPWTPERTVSADQAAVLIRSQCPGVPANDVTLLGAGWDNTAYLVDGCRVFRFPRRQIAVALLETEWRLLPAIAPRLPLAIPVPRWRGQPSVEFPWPFVGYSLLDGVTACRARLSRQQRLALAVPIASFLRTLHELDPEEMRAIGAGGDDLGRLDSGTRIPELETRIAHLVARGERIDGTAVRRLLAETPSDTTPRVPRLVHGDLYARHVLVDEHGGARGIIDWGDVHLGHPALDLALAVGLFPPEAQRVFRDAYGPISASTWKLARFRALFSEVMTLDYGSQTGDAAMVEEARTALIHTLQADS